MLDLWRCAKRLTCASTRLLLQVGRQRAELRARLVQELADARLDAATELVRGHRRADGSRRSVIDDAVDRIQRGAELGLREGSADPGKEHAVRLDRVRVRQRLMQCLQGRTRPALSELKPLARRRRPWQQQAIRGSHNCRDDPLLAISTWVACSTERRCMTARTVASAADEVSSPVERESGAAAVGTQL